MAGLQTTGEVQTENFNTLEFPIIPISIAGVFEDADDLDCCFELPLFADLESSNTFRNDVTRFIRGYEESTTAVTLTLVKISDPSLGEIALDDDTFGEFFDFGFFEDNDGSKYISYRIDWKSVLAAFGGGTYQIRTNETKIIGPVQNTFDFAYCLSNFSSRAADKTLRFEFAVEALLGDRFDVKKRVAYPEGFESQIRVPGFFGKDFSEYETEQTKFIDESLSDIKMQQVEKYMIHLDLLPSEVHDFIKTEVLQADRTEITDYNRNNAKRHLSTPVMNPSEYKPKYNEINQLASVEFELDSRFDNKLKKFCN